MDIREFVENPEPRCPCTLLVDVSLSMVKNGCVEAFNDHVHVLRNRLKEDYLASLRVEMSLVAFGDDAEVVHDFSTIDNFHPSLNVDGFTSKIGEGIRTTLNHIERRKRRYRSAGIMNYKPWVVMITDCDPIGESQEYLKSELKSANRDASFWVVGTPGSNTTHFQRIIPAENIIILNEPSFSKLFCELASAMSLVVRSSANSEVRLDTDGLMV